MLQLEKKWLIKISLRIMKETRNWQKERMAAFESKRPRKNE